MKRPKHYFDPQKVVIPDPGSDEALIAALAAAWTEERDLAKLVSEFLGGELSNELAGQLIYDQSFKDQVARHANENFPDSIRQSEFAAAASTQEDTFKRNYDGLCIEVNFIPRTRLSDPMIIINIKAGEIERGTRVVLIKVLDEAGETIGNIVMPRSARDEEDGFRQYRLEAWDSETVDLITALRKAPFEIFFTHDKL